MDQEHVDPGASAPQDGAIDFSKYSDEQLRDLRVQLDKARFPRNFEKLEAEIASRESGQQTLSFQIKFTSDGISGWLRALMLQLPFYGSGSIRVESDEILIQGWNRTWLGFSQKDEIAIPRDRIRNAYRDNEVLAFDSLRRFWWPRHYAVTSESTSDAAALAGLLPKARSIWFEKQSTDIESFYRLQRAAGHQPLVTPSIVAATVAIYAVLAVRSGSLAPNLPTLIAWGANAGSMTAHGAWWRLVAALFLHLNWLHLAVNMWVLWSVGRLAERLFGNLSFAFIYLASGVMGGLLSIAWNPFGMSVGASGAIFGILGAYLAYLLHGGTRVPQPVMRAHLIPTLLFALFSIANGLQQLGIDNAAHFGGLVTGFLLGWGLIVPAENLAGRTYTVQRAIAFAAVAALAGWLGFELAGPATSRSQEEEFLARNEWYRTGEAQNLILWQNLASQAAAGTIANTDLAYQFDHRILPFWRDAAPRLGREAASAPVAARAFASAVADFANLRLRWARAIVESARSGDLQRAIELMQQTDIAQARLDWFSLRTQYDHRAASLSNSLLITQFANLAWVDYRPCTRNALPVFNPVAPSDQASDGPARQLALGCEAQRMFLTYKFKQLERVLGSARVHPADLPDGSSSYDALIAGLDHLFDYGGLGLDQFMDRLAVWRRDIPSSVQEELVEVQALESWAYGARGYGVADTVSAANQMVFQHRLEIGEVGLKAIEPRATDYAQWYELAINLNLLRGGSAAERQALFDRSQTRFPNDFGIDDEMLHSLMPRWGGSFGDVEKFIVDQANRRGGGMAPDEKYALLCWHYAEMEGSGLDGKGFDMFKQANARPEYINTGMAILAGQHPNSDYLANAAGRLACQSGDRSEYRLFHDKLPKHYSASAWSPDFTVDQCNRKFGLTVQSNL